MMNVLFIFLCSVLKTPIQPLLKLLWRYLPVLTLIPHFHSLVIPLPKLVRLYLIDLCSRIVSLVILAEQSDSFVRFQPLVILSLRADLLTGAGIALTNAIAKVGHIIALDDEIPPAYLALVQPNIVLQHFRELQLQHTASSFPMLSAASRKNKSGGIYHGKENFDHQYQREKKQQL